MRRKMSQNEFLEKLQANNSAYREGKFKVVEFLGKNTKVSTFYGICVCQTHDLLRGSVPTIETAIDKTKYFMEVLKNKNPKMHRLVKPLSEYETSLKRMTWGYDGDEFIVNPSQMLRLKKLSIVSAKNKTKYYLNSVIKSRADCKYIDYTYFVFKGFTAKGSFRCIKHDLIYLQDTKSHLKGNQGCPKCKSRVTFYDAMSVKSLPEMFGKVYIIKLSSELEVFYKIGITSNNSNKRIKSFASVYDVDLIYEEESNLVDAYTTEQFLLENFKKFKYVPLKQFKGSSECFSVNPLDLYDELRYYYYNKQNKYEQQF